MRTRPDSGKDIGEVRDRQTIGQVTKEGAGRGTRQKGQDKGEDR